MTALTILSLVVGIVCLVGGAELLVKGAATIASKLGIAPVVIVPIVWNGFQGWRRHRQTQAHGA